MRKFHPLLNKAVRSKVKEGKTMKNYKAIKTGQVITVVNEDNDQVTIQMLDGTEKTVSKSTLLRWYKPTDETPDLEVAPIKTAPAPEAPVANTPVADTPVEDAPVADTPAPVEAAPAVKAKAVKAPKPANKPVSEPKEKPVKKIPAPKVLATKDTAIRAYLEATAKAAGYTLFSGKVAVFVAIKRNGSTLFAYTYSSKGVTLWVRSSMMVGINLPSEVKNHMFDVRITMTEDNDANRRAIGKLLAAAVLLQDLKASTAKPAKADKAPKTE